MYIMKHGYALLHHSYSFGFPLTFHHTYPGSVWYPQSVTMAEMYMDVDIKTYHWKTQCSVSEF